MITTIEYENISRLVYKNFGINLGKNKHTLVENRLAPVISQQGFSGFHDYYAHIIRDPSGQALLELANRLTTNYSFFYREKEHLDFLEQILPTRIEQPFTWSNPSLNFWSAGCAGGEEPYSISMALREYASRQPLAPWDLGILATDIDTNKLKESHRGVYSTDRIKGVPPAIRARYFTPAGSDLWQVKPEITKPVHLSQFNLMQQSFQFKGKFFAVFCRNVMIYFDRVTTNALVRRFYDVIEDGGYLFIGLTETLDKGNCPFHYVAPSIYQKRVGR